MEELNYVSEYDPDPFLYFQIYSKKKLKKWSVERSKVTQFKKEFSMMVSNCKENFDYCIDLKKSGQHMLVLDIDVKKNVQVSNSELFAYIDNYVARFFGSIVCEIPVQKKQFFLCLVYKNPKKNSIHVYMPEIFMSSEDYELFINDSRGRLDKSKFVLDEPINFNLPKCNKSSIYKLEKIMLHNGTEHVMFGSFNEECIKFFNKNNKFKDNLIGKFASIKNSQDLLFPIYNLEIRYKVYLLYYNTFVSNTKQEDKFLFAKLKLKNGLEKFVYKDIKWNIINYGDTKSKNLIFLFKYIHETNYLISGSNSLSKSLNLWIVKESAPKNVDRRNGIDEIIDEINEKIKLISPFFKKVDITEWFLGDPDYSMIYLYTVLSEILNREVFLEFKKLKINLDMFDDDPLGSKKRKCEYEDTRSSKKRNYEEIPKRKINDSKSLKKRNVISLGKDANSNYNINKEITYVIHKLNLKDRERRAMERLKRFNATALNDAYKEFSMVSLVSTVMKRLYGNGNMNSHYVKAKEKGVCSFIGRQFYLDNAYLLAEESEDEKKDPKFLISNLLSNYCPIVKLDLKNTYIWNGDSWREFEKDSLSHFIDVILQDVADACNNNDRISNSSAIKEYIKSDILLKIGKLERFVKMDTNPWFLYSKDGRILDLLTMTTSINVPEHFCTSGSRLDISVENIDLQEGKNFSKILNQDFVDTVKESIIKTGHLNDVATTYAEKSLIYLLCSLMDFDADKINLLTWILTYALTGTNPHKFLFWFWGGNDNGKTTLFNLINTIFGSYRSVLTDDSLTNIKGKNKTDIFNGIHKRLCVCEDFMGELNDSYIKKLTGNNVTDIRELFKNCGEGTPCFKILLSTNDPPDCKNPSAALLARFCLVKFNCTFKDEFDVKSIKEQIETKKYAPMTLSEFKSSASLLFNLLLYLLDSQILENGFVKKIDTKYYKTKDLEEFIEPITMLHKFMIEYNINVRAIDQKIYASTLRTKINIFVTRTKLQKFKQKLFDDFCLKFKDRIVKSEDEDRMDVDEEEEADVNLEMKNLFSKKRDSTKKPVLSEDDFYFKNMSFGITLNSLQQGK